METKLTTNVKNEEISFEFKGYCFPHMGFELSGSKLDNTNFYSSTLGVIDVQI